MKKLVVVNGEQSATDDFQGFNWDNFEYGDIVWTEDESFDAIACYYISQADGIVSLRALSDREARHAIAWHAHNVLQIF